MPTPTSQDNIFNLSSEKSFSMKATQEKHNPDFKGKHEQVSVNFLESGVVYLGCICAMPTREEQ